jgi:hypothetical protein
VFSVAYVPPEHPLSLAIYPGFHVPAWPTGLKTVPIPSVIPLDWGDWSCLTFHYGIGLTETQPFPPRFMIYEGSLRLFADAFVIECVKAMWAADAKAHSLRS